LGYIFKKLKISFTILIFLFTSLSHLSIIELIQYYGQAQLIHLNTALNESSKQEEDSTQKEIKDNVEDQEKYCSRSYFVLHIYAAIYDVNQFILFNANMTNHPYNNNILQPPEFG
jgi:hypothetical protein